MKEGGLGAPVRHPHFWDTPDFVDEQKIDEEMRRVFDVCHGCRRCFSLCDSFPRLFDLIDNSPTGELDGVESKDFQSVVDACTLCDLCFMAKCPYVPPHEFNLDVPHLMLRYRYARRQKGEVDRVQDELIKTDRNAALSMPLAPLVNWASKVDNKLTRPVMEKVLGIHRDAAIPTYAPTTWVRTAQANPIPVNEEAPGFGKKAVIFATCLCNYNNPSLGVSIQRLLHHNGVQTEVVYPGCCGMPHLESGDLHKVTQNALHIAEALLPWLNKGYEVIAPVPSCALMLKGEWPLIFPENEAVSRLSQATWDVAHYLMSLHKTVGLTPGLNPLATKKVTMHIACHVRAQNIGHKSAELLRLIPNLEVDVIERCSGHGGSWGMMVDNFEIALKVGKPVARQAQSFGNQTVLSECPLAAAHIIQGLERLEEGGDAVFVSAHPLQILAQSYGLEGKS